MDWIKVKVRHAEYDFAGASDSVFRTWIMMMIYVAATERKPLRNDLCKRYTENNVKKLENWLEQVDVELDTIIDKVLEDVDYVNSRKSHNRKYMRKYRSNTLRKPLREQHVMGKRREEKRREDKSNKLLSTKDFLTSLKHNVSYKHIDVEHELGKMDAWLSTHPGRQKTQKFIVNWLNKIEKPIEATRRMPS